MKILTKNLQICEIIKKTKNKKKKKQKKQPVKETPILFDELFPVLDNAIVGSADDELVLLVSYHAEVRNEIHVEAGVGRLPT